jgi:hypothetical protein
MHPNTNRALMYVQANGLVDMLVTIEPQYRMMISLGYDFSFLDLISHNTYSSSSDGDAACMAIIDDMTSKIPHTVETGFGPTARHITFENALGRIGDKLGKNIYR